MDQERFDRFVRDAAGGGRRGVLRALSGAILSAGVLGAADVAAKGKRRKRRASAEACPPCPACKRCNAQGRCVVDRSTNGQCCPRLGDRTGACFEGHCLPASTCESAGCVGSTCGTFNSCGDNPECICWSVAGGGTFCAFPGNCGAACPNGQADCPADHICLIDTCCPGGGAICSPRDSACTAGGAARAATKRGQQGPTMDGR
jgi:hypothetical protein